MGPIKSAAVAFILSMGGFLAYHLLASPPGGIGEFQGIQDLGQWATPASAIIAAIVFIFALFAKAASKTE